MGNLFDVKKTFKENQRSAAYCLGRTTDHLCHTPFVARVPDMFLRKGVIVYKSLSTAAAAGQANKS